LVGETKPLIGAAFEPHLTLMSTNITTGAQGGMLTILFGDTDFGPVTNGTATARIGGIISIINPNLGATASTAGQISYSTFADGSNSVLGLATPVTTQNGLMGPTFDSNATANIAFGPNTALTQQVVVVQGPGVLTGFNSILRIVSAASVPENGSTIVMLVAAAITLELVRRRVHPSPQ
jgi:hypothetical protein